MGLRRVHQSNGLQAMADERDRQIDALGFTSEHDKNHTPEELIEAGLCYAELAYRQLYNRQLLYERVQDNEPPKRWPWSREVWKPGGVFTNLTKAGALLAAGYDRQEVILLDEIGSLE